MDTTFQINGSQGHLCCRQQLPQGGGKCPIVILAHGLAGNMNYPMWDILAQRLNGEGIGIVRFDFNGCGQSEGEFQNMTIANEIEDLMAVLAWVLGQPRTASVSLAGHSQGGVVCGMAAGVCGNSVIHSLGLLSAAASVRDDALRGNFLGAIFDPWHLDKAWYEIPGNGLKLGRAYIQTAMNLPIYETTAKYAGPTLVLNGLADQIVPYTYAERYHALLPHSNLVLLPGENHRCSVNLPHAANLVADWFINQLNARQ